MHPVMRRSAVALVLGLVLLTTLVAAAPARAATQLVTFDDLAASTPTANTTVSDQYAAPGGVVAFPGPPDAGRQPVVRAEPGKAHSGTNVADVSTCAGVLNGCGENYSPPFTRGAPEHVRELRQRVCRTAQRSAESGERHDRRVRRRRGRDRSLARRDREPGRRFRPADHRHRSELPDRLVRHHRRACRRRRPDRLRRSARHDARCTAAAGHGVRDRQRGQRRRPGAVGSGAGPDQPDQRVARKRGAQRDRPADRPQRELQPDGDRRDGHDVDDDADRHGPRADARRLHDDDDHRDARRDLRAGAARASRASCACARTATATSPSPTSTRAPRGVCADRGPTSTSPSRRPCTSMGSS